MSIFSLNNTFEAPIPSGNYDGAQMPTPKFEKRVQLGEVGEGLLSSMMKQLQLLKVRELSPGQPFIGLVWMVETTNVVNKYDNTTWDITYKFYDGNGEYYTAKQWGFSSKVEVKETPMCITGAVMDYDDRKVIRIDKSEFYQNTVPRSVFIKVLDYLDVELEKFRENVERIDRPMALAWVKYMLNDVNLIATMKESSYKHTIGAKLGSKFLYANSVIESLDRVNKIRGDLDEGLYVLMVIAYMINLQVSQQEENEQSVVFTVLDSIYSKGLMAEKETAQKVIELLVGRVNDYSTNTEAIIVKNTINNLEKSVMQGVR